MGASRHRGRSFLAACTSFATFGLLLTGCGGGSQTGGTQQPPPPPPENYNLIVGPNSLTLQQGGAPQPITLEFTGVGSETAFTVTVSFTNLPTGISVSPSGPVTLSSPSAVETIFVLASPAAATGQISMNIASTNGQVNNTNSLSLTVHAAAPFQLSLTPTSLTLTDGVAGSVQATVAASGTSPSVSLSTSTEPPRWDFNNPTITGSGSGPFSIWFAPGLTFPDASSIPVFVTATSGSDTSTAVVTISTQTFPPNTALTRGTYLQTDDGPAGAVYDMARKLLFVTVTNLNQVRVYSTVNFQQVAAIAVERPGAIDESADGTAVFVGGLSKVITIDPAFLQVVQVTHVPQKPSLVLGTQALPVQLVTLSTGEVLVLSYSGGNVLLWNPKTGTMVATDPPGFPSTLLLTRSADHGTVFLYSGAPVSAGSILYSATTKMYGQAITGLPGNQAALSPDGSRIAVITTPIDSVGGTVSVYDDLFNLVDSIPLANQGAGPPIYSLDGSTLYLVVEQEGIGSIGVAYESQTLAPQGVFSADMALPVAIDETGMLYGVNGAVTYGIDGAPGNAVLTAADGSHPGALLAGLTQPPGVNFPDVIYSNEGYSAKSINSVLVGGGFDPNGQYSIYIGSPPASLSAIAATGVEVASSSSLSFILPESNASGVMNVTLTRPDGWYQVIPNGVNYRPVILGLEPSGLLPSTQTTINIYGYGFKNVQGVTVGGKAATVLGSAYLTNNPGGMFPMETLQVQVPPGTPGLADVTVTEQRSTTLTATVAGGIQYLSNGQVYPLQGSLFQVVYDQQRNRLYVSNNDHNRIEIFDIASHTVLTPISVGNGPTYIALTPDFAELAVLNATDATVSVINLGSGTISGTYPVLTAQETAAYATVVMMTAMTPHRVLVDTQTPDSPPTRDLHVLNLDSGSLSCSGVTGCDSTGQNINVGFPAYAMVSSSDAAEIFLTDGASQLALLNVSQNSITNAIGPVGQGPNAASNADGTIFASNLSTCTQQLLSINQAGPDIFYFDGNVDGDELDLISGEALNPSGSLLFVWHEQTTGTPFDEVDVFDVNKGRLDLRVAAPENHSTGEKSIAIDQTGTKLFLLTASGITIEQLSVVPLSIAEISPASGSAGAQVTVRGSGFQTGATLTFGATVVSSTLVDPMTITATVPVLPSGAVQVTVTNPDGGQYSLDAAFAMN